jgi:hypothetical protein
MLISLAGCSNNKVSKYYNSMKTNNKGFYGYVLDLRVHGSVNKQVINDIARIENYKNIEYKISIINHNLKDIQEISNKSKQVEESIYIKDGKKYVLNGKNEYIETKKNIKYDNPLVYLNGLNDIPTNGKSNKEAIGIKTYNVFRVNYSVETLKSIIDDINLNIHYFNTNNEGKIYIDSEGYTYRIIYNFNNLNITATYFLKTKNEKIIFPAELKDN